MMKQTVAELMALPPRARCRAVYEPKHKCISIRDKDGDELYWFEINRCNTLPKLVEWLHHLSGKNWFDRDIAHDLIEVACKRMDHNIFVHA